MMTNSNAVIVTGPGSLQNGLLALMTAMPQIGVVGEAEDASAALEMVAEHRPDLLVVITTGNEASLGGVEEAILTIASACRPGAFG
jgi:DNA-binding NarL/FixJ family response regulator